MSQNVAGSRQPPLLGQMARQVSRWWWVPLVAGLLSIVLGLAILASPWTVKALVVVTGLLFVIHGVSLVLSPAYAGGLTGRAVARRDHRGHRRHRPAGVARPEPAAARGLRRRLARGLG